MLNVQQANVYTDFNGLAQLKNGAKDKTPESIKEVAKQFESVFVGMMLKSMRQAKLADSILDSSQSDFYRDMYDQQLSINLSGEQGIGLADLIEKQLSPDQSSTAVRNQSIADYERQALIRKFDASLDEATAKSRIGGDNSLDSVTRQLNVQVLLKAGDYLQEIPINHQDIDSAEDFVHQLRPYAEQAAKDLGVDAKILLAQAALETGWGKSIIKTSDGSSSHNLFNIKANKSWQGQQARVSTLEFREGIAKKEMAGFRSYTSYKESFNDYVDFIKTNPRYEAAIKMVKKPERYMDELQQAGYATDPDYAAKVMKIYHSKMITNAIPDVLSVKQSSTADNS